MEVSGDNPNLWPFVEQQFSDWQVQSPVNIIPQYANNVNLTSLLYYRYWREDNSVLIKIGNKGNALHISSVDIIRAHITGGPLFEKEYLFSRMHIYWNTEGDIGSEHLINSQ
ncbi:carbonic anhydrase 7-like, partial [Aphis craccivora]